MTEEKIDPPKQKKMLGVFLCDRCQKEIGCNADDPINITSLGQFHSLCMKAVYKERRE